MNVAELVAAAAADHGDRPAIVQPGGPSLTWAELAGRVAGVAALLRQQGVEPGGRVAVALPNGAAFAEAYWGVLAAGATAVPVNPTYTPPEVAHLLTDSGARMVLADPALADVVKAARTPARVLPVTADTAAPTRWTDPPTGGDDCAVICYTSGTTGRPKGARLTHRNFLANLTSFSDLPLLALRSEDVLLGVLPFFHIFGLNVILNAAARHGACVLALPRFSPVASLAAMAAGGVSIAYGAPPMFAAWTAVPPEQRPPLPALRAAISGADALPVHTWSSFADRYGIEILEGYGLTECAPVLASNAASPAVRPGTVGHQLPDVDVRIDEQGEVLARGDNVFEGYHDQPEATADAFTADGWFRTGDIGALDADGYLRITGRLKDMVIVSGFNVYPREVEQALREHPAVFDAAVVGVPDARTGERVHAFVVPAVRHGIDVEDVLAFCRTRLARYKVPREVEVVADLARLKH